jgi:NADH:ubiquinone oxidoreductase subunit E
LLPILQALQDEFGYVDEAPVTPIVCASNISITICGAEACQSMGCDGSIRDVEKPAGSTNRRNDSRRNFYG